MSISVRKERTRYNPNLSEEEPLFNASTINPGSAPVMPQIPAETSCSQVPAPGADLRHVVAMLADIELVTLVVIVPPVGHFVNHRGIAMKSEDHRLVGREQFVKILIFQTMGMLGLRLQYHQIHNIDDPDADVGDIRAQEGHGSECFKGRHISGTGHDDLGTTDIVAGPSPNTRADGAVAN